MNDHDFNHFTDMEHLFDQASPDGGAGEMQAAPRRSALPNRAGRSGFGSDVTAFPASVQRHLDEAAGLMRRQQPPQAMSALQAAATELARANPELFTLCVAAQMGAQGLTFEDQRMSTTTTTDDRYVLGIRVGRDVRTVTSTDANRRTIRIG